MKKSVLTALAVSVAVGGIGLSTAASANPRGGNMPAFEDFDTNGDGIITQEEVGAKEAVKFAEFDTNGDGFLDADELKDRMLTRGERRRGGGNRGGQGQQGHGNPERTQTQQQERAQTQQRERTQSQQRERMDLAVTHMLQRADADGDGSLSIEESRPPQAGKMFERFDADGNGEVTQEEWDAAIAQRGQRNN